MLIRLLKQTKAGKVTLRRSGAMCAVTGPSFEFVTGLLDFEYPNYENVLPPASSNIALCGRADLVGALARLSAVANREPTPLVALSWTDGGSLHIALARQPGDAEDVLAAEARGDARIVLPLPQVASMISNFNCARLHLEVASAVSPLVLRGVRGKYGTLARCGWASQT
jgi:DNA polymerase III subunit beta